MTDAEVRQVLSKPLIRVSDYARIFERSIATAYGDCARGDVDTVRIGKRTLRVKTAPLRKKLGLDVEAAADHAEAAAA